MRVESERVATLEADALAPLIAESETSGLRFVRRLADEWATAANRFDRPGEALFVARDGAAIVGVGGLNVDPYAAGASIGRVRHLYVLTAHRRVGVGERLVTAIVAAARGRFHTLRLSTSISDAARLYERLGFRPRPGAVHCTHVMEIEPATTD